jgi:hypothetical protein
MNRHCGHTGQVKRWSEAIRNPQHRHCGEESRNNQESNLFAFTLLRLLRCFRNNILAFVLVLISFSSHASILTVKQDGTGNFTTIQAGINAALTGDTVLVYPGTYFENINYNSKSITVASLYLTTGIQNYIHTTIIDGASNGSCVYISNSTGFGAILSGFTLQHGSGSTSSKAGGGICIRISVIAIESCIVKDNHSLIGGGISCLFSEVRLSGTVVKNNTALIQAGGIIISNDCDFIFDSIQKNSVYLNYGPNGCDIAKTISLDEQHIILDTATVISPDSYFFYSRDIDGNQLNNLTWEIDHGKVEQVNADLYVSVDGNNLNSGLTSSDPLKTISFAMRKIIPDSINSKMIHLNSGTYSHSTNNEIFPICQRSYIELVGSNSESSIIDAELLYPLYNSNTYTKSFTITNLTFTRGNDNNNYTMGIYGGFEIVACENVRFQNISISETNGYLSSALTSRASDINICELRVFNNSGGFPIDLSNTSQNFRQSNIANSFIYNNEPGATIDLGRGSAIQFVGTSSYPQVAHSKIINTVISENTYTEESWSNFGISGITCINYAHLNLINSTIANNVVTNPVPAGQVYALEGAEVNFYNSIVYGTEDYEIFLGDGTPTSDIATLNISNTNVKGGESNIQNWNNIHNLNWLEGNIDEDPLWEGGEPYSYALQPGSPCIDAGVPMFEEGMEYPYIKEDEGKYVLYMLDGDTVTLPAYDLAGNPRISGGKIDMGAYEWQDTATRVEKFKVQSSKMEVYPNPFVSNTFISFTTAEDHFISLEVISLMGERIRTIASNKFPSGNYRLVWNGKDDAEFEVKPGFYLICFYLDGKPVSTASVVKKRG